MSRAKKCDNFDDKRITHYDKAAGRSWKQGKGGKSVIVVHCRGA